MTHPLAFNYTEALGEARAVVDTALARLAGEQVLPRLWRRDHSVWSPTAQGVEDRLGWLDLPTCMVDCLEPLAALRHEARADGLTQAVLLAVGGSSLSPAVFNDAFGSAQGGLELDILDTANPEAVLWRAERLDPERTLFVVASKSGETVETLSLLKFFFGWAAERLGERAASSHFAAITDPESPLAALAEEWGFRRTLLGHPEAFGPFSALSAFGLGPAALLGLDTGRLLESARQVADACGAAVPVERNAAARLGVTMAQLALAGQDKLTLLIDQRLGSSFGRWLEHLVAGSTGKAGRGVLPIEGESLAAPLSSYGPDRLFVSLGRDDQEGSHLDAIKAAGHPLLQMTVGDAHDLGGLIVLWELAAAIAGHCLGLNPFDQPNVERSKAATGQLCKSFKAQGELPLERPTLADGLLTVFGELPAEAETPLEALKAFLEHTRPPEYVAIQAFLPSTAENASALAALRLRLRDELGVAVTVGDGPSCARSTGQIHKGDAGHGRVIQLTADAQRDAPIPDEMGFRQGALSFGVLEAAQAMGDRQALVEARRRVIRFHLGHDVAAGLWVLTHAFDRSRSSSIPPG